MNKKEVGEIRRRLKPERNNISRIYGCYVNSAYACDLRALSDMSLLIAVDYAAILRHEPERVLDRLGKQKDDRGACKLKVTHFLAALCFLARFVVNNAADEHCPDLDLGDKAEVLGVKQAPLSAVQAVDGDGAAGDWLHRVQHTVDPVTL